MYGAGNILKPLSSTFFWAPFGQLADFFAFAEFSRISYSYLLSPLIFPLLWLDFCHHFLARVSRFIKINSIHNITTPGQEFLDIV